MALVPAVLAQLRAQGVDSPVVVGGIIPEEDRPKLLASGVTAVYTPKDFQLSTIMRDIAEIVAANRG
jgi:(2R)-ethylmalonyl-CoA mutase